MQLLRRSVFSEAFFIPFLLLGFGFAVPCAATPLNWQLYNNGTEDMQFRINTNLGSSPSALLTGYNGAYGFGPSLPWLGWGETFSVDSTSTLLSVDLRITASSGSTGDFAVAVNGFNPSTLVLGTTLASTVKLAAAYVGDFTAAPVSNFDLSAAGATLSAGQTYLVSVYALDGFSGVLYSQAAGNIYSGGASYFTPSPPVPEPGTVGMVSVGLVGLVVGARRRRMSAEIHWRLSKHAPASVGAFS